ncbi:hypothetical protein [Amycolatopsis nigrescens]|uniref:hypothetical protein n=1 Tax=Amycolatopsis nigrescens TaxID=381445 RepID=UPI000371E1FE|nr:hypothetical protein [Amycolatopsis nigrescens]
MDGYHVDPEVLRTASGAIAKAIGKADKLELEKISEDASAFGDDSVSGALAGFCSTWELASGILQQRSASAGEALDGAADAYVEEDRRAKMPEPEPSPQPSPTPGPQGGS